MGWEVGGAEGGWGTSFSPYICSTRVLAQEYLTRSVHVDPIGGLLFVWLLEPPAVPARRPFLLFGSAEE